MLWAAWMSASATPSTTPIRTCACPRARPQVQGDQALAFLRTRHAFADGGDLGRIKAQQGFLSSLTRKIKSDGTLGNPAKMLHIADIVTRNLTVDDGLASIPTLLTIGNRLKNIDISKVAFVAVPTVPAASDPNRLQMAEPAASQLFAALRKDVDLTDPTATPSPSALRRTASASAEPQPPTAAAPTTRRCSRSPWPTDPATPARTQEIMQALIAGGFTQLGQLAATPVRQPRSTTGQASPTSPPTWRPCWGFRPRRCCRPPGVAGVQVYLGTDFVVGHQDGATPRALPKDIVNQTAGDTVCQQANPELITR